MLTKEEIHEQISLVNNQLSSTAFEFKQLIHLAQGENYLQLASLEFQENNLIQSRLTLKLSLEQFLLGFRYKNTKPSDRHPIGNVKVKDKAMNPERGLRALMIAIILKDYEIATEIAALIWDPPFSAYIGPSGACSYEEQLLAHSYRNFILNDPSVEATIQDLDSVITKSNDLKLYAHFLKSFLLNDSTLTNDKIENLINIVQQNDNLNLIGLGTIRILLTKGWIDQNFIESKKYASIFN
ncbi:MAG: hypothetical protein ACJASQ_004319 [Crocinitomicaceae bacterium]|jgi:hypothetical protein